MQWVGLDRFVAEAAVELSNSLPKRLAGADAVHLATAVRAGCQYFMAYDRKYPYGDDVQGVTVMNPAVVWDPQLPYGGSRAGRARLTSGACLVAAPGAGAGERRSAARLRGLRGGRAGR